ncbi:unnamed protein product [Rotaria magnacalcarata]|uniref:Uncharacterized protein n=1 Tax=Rotaria magnacalcarata TaxID=392030 RepID=A0A8S3GJ73_9BILA|nr:unnamed protein product [Rotaria magnacalcarata]CAF5226227.1 unnamed protein product [Rotaria magnacalcarata]
MPIQPIPIHTVPTNEDFLLGLNDCPRYEQIEKEVYESDEFKSMNTYYELISKTYRTNKNYGMTHDSRGLLSIQSR